MKKLMRILALALCLMMMVPAALAAEGDAVVARSGEGTDGFQDYIRYMTALDDTVYLLGGNGVYTYRVGESDVTKACAFENGLTLPEELLSEDEGVTTNIDSLYGMFGRDGSLYLLATIMESWSEGNGEETLYYNRVRDEAVLFELVLGEDGTASLTEADRYDWIDLIQEEDNYSYARGSNGSTYLDGKLYFRSQDESWNDVVYCLDLDSGDLSTIDELASAQSLCAYADGKLLAVLYNWEKPTEAIIASYDPEAGSIETLLELTVPEYTYPQGLVADTESGEVFYVRQGAIWSLDLESGESEEVCDMPVETDYGATPVLLQNKYYVTYSYQGVAVRNIHPSDGEKAAYTLRVADNSYSNVLTNAYYDFTNTHGDAMVVLSHDYMNDSQMIEDMMNRSDAWDIYVRSSSDESYDAVFKRGYMAELSGSESLNQLVDSFYPTIQEQLKRDGHLVALPVEVYEGSCVGVNLKALEKLGLTVEEIPTNWEDLLRFLAEDLPDLLPDDGTVSLYESGTDARSARDQLMNMILTDYNKYLQYSGIEQGYNTEIMNRLLNLLDEIDFTRLGQPEEIDWDNYEWTWDEAGYLLTYGSYLPSSYSGEETRTLPLSLTADTPFVLSLDCNVIFVNPFSKNVDKAIEFVEAVADRLSNSVIYALDPSKTEPIRSSYYEEAKQESQKYYEDLKKQYDEAEEADKQMLEEQLAEYEKYLENFDNYYWEVNPDSIAWYHEHDDMVRISGFNMMYGQGDASEEIWNLRSQYAEKQITAAEFLEGIDKKLQMMILENQ